MTSHTQVAQLFCLKLIKQSVFVCGMHSPKRVVEGHVVETSVERAQDTELKTAQRQVESQSRQIMDLKKMVSCRGVEYGTMGK